MKKYFFLLLLCCTYHLQAQEFSAKKGTEMSKSGFSSVKVAGVCHNRYYIVSTKGNTNNRKNILRTYDFDNKLIAEKEIPSELNGSLLTLLRIVNARAGDYAVWEGIDKRTRRKTDIIQKIDDSGELNGELMVMATGNESFAYISSVQWRGQSQQSNTLDINGIFISADSSKICCVSTSAGADKNQQITIKMMDASLGVLWEKTIQLPYRENEFAIDNILIANSGKVLLSAKYFNLPAIRKVILRHIVKVLSIDETGSKELDFELTDKNETVNVEFVQGGNNEVIVCGFYSRGKNSGPPIINGSFAYKLNAGGDKVIKTVLNEIPEDLLPIIRCNTIQPKGDPGLALSDCILLSDGGIMITGAQDILAISHNRIVIFYDKDLNARNSYALPALSSGERWDNIRTFAMNKKAIILYGSSRKYDGGVLAATSNLLSSSDIKGPEFIPLASVGESALFFQGRYAQKIDESRILVTIYDDYKLRVGVLTVKQSVH